MATAALLEKLSEIISALDKPISNEEVTDGWTAKDKKTAVDMFLAIRLAVEYDRHLPPLNIQKGLNHWGVVCGPIFDQAVAIAVELKSLDQASL
jgi:hypothetical protein